MKIWFRSDEKKTEFLSSNGVGTTLRIHPQYINEMLSEKAKWKLLKDAMCSLEKNPQNSRCTAT